MHKFELNKRSNSTTAQAVEEAADLANPANNNKTILLRTRTPTATFTNVTVIPMRIVSSRNYNRTLNPANSMETATSVTPSVTKRTTAGTTQQARTSVPTCLGRNTTIRITTMRLDPQRPARLPSK
jgi:hypothetical protein